MTSEIFKCEYCNKEFNRVNSKGPKPKYCSVGHRQRAFEVRRLSNYKSLLNDIVLLLKDLELLFNTTYSGGGPPLSSQEINNKILDVNKPGSLLGRIANRPDVLRAMNK